MTRQDEVREGEARRELREAEEVLSRASYDYDRSSKLPLKHRLAYQDAYFRACRRRREAQRRLTEILAQRRSPEEVQP